jgi:hypothetical protein
MLTVIARLRVVFLWIDVRDIFVTISDSIRDTSRLSNRVIVPIFRSDSAFIRKC